MTLRLLVFNSSSNFFLVLLTSFVVYDEFSLAVVEVIENRFCVPLRLPFPGVDPDELLQEMQVLKKKETNTGEGKVFAYVYTMENEHFENLRKAFDMFTESTGKPTIYFHLAGFQHYYPVREEQLSHNSERTIKLRVEEGKEESIQKRDESRRIKRDESIRGEQRKWIAKWRVDRWIVFV